MINSRLFEWYGIDTTKDLQIKTYCPRPYETVLIDKQGSCFLCECTSWLPQSVGNLHLQSLDKILSSPMAEQIRSSIQDHSYRYCNNHQCSYLHETRSIDPITGTDIFLKTLPIKQIKNVRLAIDDSCNLRCPSCRRELIYIKEGKNFQRRLFLADRINEWLKTINHPIKVHIGSDGDPFASQVYTYFMTHAPQNKNLQYSILTNGLLIKDFDQKVPYILQNLTALGVSIDGASKNTYEKLRLGGSWQKINDSLKYIQTLRKKYNFSFRLHFVVQKDNFHEMEKIIDVGRKYDADHVWLNKIENWNVMNNFKEQDIWQTTEYLNHLEKIKKIVQQQTNRFVECPLILDMKKNTNTNLQT